MQTPNPTPEIQKKRVITDHSLDHERQKTDETLVTGLENAEDSTDLHVEDKRWEEDKKNVLARTLADADEKKSDDERLLEERQRADLAIEKERAIADQAIDRERDAKRALRHRMLEEERIQTDRSLDEERTKTDAVVHAEATAHSQTKISLTTRDEFLAIVSHDLRNPIGAIASCSEMLLSDPSLNVGNSELREWIELIQRNANSAMRLINDLLDMERVALGKLSLSLADHSINEIIRESIERFHREATAKKVNFKVVSAEGNDKVACDSDRLQQVLSNLIGNAIKFVAAEGTITLETKLSDTEVQVSVSDTGPGIPPDKFDRIFDRFAQIESKTRKGLGLGLYISRMLVEAHKGKIWVESKVGTGSTFHFTIPRKISP